MAWLKLKCRIQPAEPQDHTLRTRAEQFKIHSCLVVCDNAMWAFRFTFLLLWCFSVIATLLRDPLRNFEILFAEPMEKAGGPQKKSKENRKTKKARNNKKKIGGSG